MKIKARDLDGRSVSSIVERVAGMDESEICKTFVLREFTTSRRYGMRDGGYVETIILRGEGDAVEVEADMELTLRLPPDAVRYERIVHALEDMATNSERRIEMTPNGQLLFSA